MWNYYTNDGPIVLAGSQAKVFRLGARTLSEDVGWSESDDSWVDASGIRAFDSLTQLQKQVAILMVASAALDPDIPMPDLTAVLEGTVTVIYGWLESLIDEEVSVGKSTNVRTIVSEALLEIDYWEEVKGAYEPGEEPDGPLPIDSDDAEEWCFLARSLSYELVDGDDDFSMDNKLLDAPPGEAAKMYETFGISTDYFTAIIDDPVKRLVAVRGATLENRRDVDPFGYNALLMSPGTRRSR
jgi:hypothetical protein